MVEEAVDTLQQSHHLDIHRFTITFLKRNVKESEKMSFFISERLKTTSILIHQLFLDRLYHIIRIINAHPAPEGRVLPWELKRALAWFSCSSCFT